MNSTLQIASMKNIYTIFILSLTFLMVSCESGDIPNDVNSDVIFYMDGTLNGEPITINAGQEDVYLFTDYQTDSNSLYHFEGNFAKTGLCVNNCDEALKISISNYIDGSIFDIDAGLFEGNYRIATQQIDSMTVYETMFQSSALGNSTTTSRWDFGDGNISPNQHPTHQFETPAPVVKLEVKDLFGCKSIARTTLNLITNEYCQQDFYFTYNPSTGIYKFAPFGGAQQNTTYHWGIITPTFTKQSANSTFHTDVPTNDQFEVCLDAIVASGCVSQICKTIDGNTKTLSCAAAFQFNTQPSQRIRADQIFSNIEIEYTTPDGIRYSNKNGNQTGENYFKIIEISDFDINENGQPTKKITADVKCQLFDVNGNIVVLESTNLVFAVAFPD